MLVVTYLGTLLCIAWATTMLAIDPDLHALQILSYVSYACAAITLAYSVYTVVATKAVPKIVRWIKFKMTARPMTAKLLESYEFRTLFFSGCSLSLTVIYAGYNAVIAAMGIVPVWHLSLAGYYVFLVCMRVGVLHYRKKEHDGKGERSALVDLKKFRNCGILLIVTILALSVAIAQMVDEGAGFTKSGMMIYVAAAYTAVRVTTSIMNFLKAKRSDDYTLQTLRNVNLADAAVAVLSLQTAMFASFGSEGVNVALFNALTGAGVCLIVLLLGIYMIVKGSKGIKNRRENIRE